MQVATLSPPGYEYPFDRDGFRFRFLSASENVAGKPKPPFSAGTDRRRQLLSNNSSNTNIAAGSTSRSRSITPPSSLSSEISSEERTPAEEEQRRAVRQCQNLQHLGRPLLARPGSAENNQHVDTFSISAITVSHLIASLFALCVRLDAVVLHVGSSFCVKCMSLS